MIIHVRCLCFKNKLLNLCITRETWETKLNFFFSTNWLLLFNLESIHFLVIVETIVFLKKEVFQSIYVHYLYEIIRPKEETI